MSGDDAGVSGRTALGGGPAPDARSPLHPSQRTGLLLAGGAGRRMDGQDKGLLMLHGRPLAAWVLDALRPQVGPVLLSVNRNQARYRELGVPLITDDLAGFQGPLAGLASALLPSARPPSARPLDALPPGALMQGLATPWLLVVPCDAPLVPTDLGQRLARALVANPGSAIAVARVGTRVHPLHALLATDLGPDLHAYLAGGGRSVMGWLARHPVCEVPCDDWPDAFSNCNRPDDLARLHTRVRAQQPWS